MEWIGMKEKESKAKGQNRKQYTAYGTCIT